MLLELRDSPAHLGFPGQLSLEEPGWGLWRSFLAVQGRALKRGPWTVGDHAVPHTESNNVS